MPTIDEIASEYMRMRENGLDSREALHALRHHIDPLSQDDKDTLGASLRKWENQQNASEKTISVRPDDGRLQAAAKKSVIKPLKPELHQKANWIECPNCGKRNEPQEAFCYSCGYILNAADGKVNTRLFADAPSDMFSDDYFGEESLLLLTVPDQSKIYQLRPQSRSGAMLIGRGSTHSDNKPDIDLNEANGTQMGVSRQHVAIEYDSNGSAIQIHDMGSANGTYVNGQRLHPKEVRVLRNGDELRLGRLTVIVKYRHPGAAIEDDV